MYKQTWNTWNIHTDILILQRRFKLYVLSYVYYVMGSFVVRSCKATIGYLNLPLVLIKSWTYSNIAVFLSIARLTSPRKSSESLGATSGTVRDIESNNFTLFSAYKGHTKKKWYASSISKPQLQDGSSSTKRLKCRCAFNLLQPISSLAWWIFENLSPTLNHGILVGGWKWNFNLRSKTFRLGELRIVFWYFIRQNRLSEGHTGKEIQNEIESNGYMRLQA